MDVEQFIKEFEAKQHVRRQKRVDTQLTLPFWNEQQRAMPNSILRSCVFGALNIRKGKEKREMLEREVLATTGSDSIIYTGIRLDQEHQTLLETLMHIARDQQLGERCDVTIYQLLKALDKTDTGGNRKVLLRQLAHLKATAVEIKQGPYSYTGSFVDDAYRDDDTGRVIIILNQKLVALFQPGHYTKLSWEIRRNLTRPLAKWLHGYYSSHANPYDVSVQFIHRLCGSETKSIKDFRNKLLIPSLNELSAACAEHGEHFAWAIQPSGLVSVRRDKTASPQLPLKYSEVTKGKGLDVGPPASS